jgi:hypothetical protein
VPGPLRAPRRAPLRAPLRDASIPAPAARRLGHLALTVVLLGTAFGVGSTSANLPASAAGPESGTVSGRVHDDHDADGVRDAGEPGVAGIVVRAFDATGARS